MATAVAVAQPPSALLAVPAEVVADRHQLVRSCVAAAARLRCGTSVMQGECTAGAIGTPLACWRLSTPLHSVQAAGTHLQTTLLSPARAPFVVAAAVEASQLH